MKNKAAIIIPLMLGTFMAALDNSIVNVSIPVMQRQFNVQIDDIQWVITAYMLAFCVFMPLTNWLKDKIGLYKMYLISISVFTAGSVMCGFSPSLAILIPARVLQALGGGALTPVGLAMLSAAFGNEERGKIMGWWGLGVVVGPALGPTLGGALTQYFGWPSIFFVNVPFAALALFLSVKNLKEIGKKADEAPPFDLTGYLFFIVFIILFQYSVGSVEKLGFSSVLLYATFAGSIVCLIFFIKTELRKKDPVLDLSLFKSKEFFAGILVTAGRSVALFGGLFLLPFLFQSLMGYSELQTGLLLLPTSVVLAIFVPLAGNYADKHGARYITIVGLILITVSTIEIAFLDKGSSIVSIIIPMLIRGAGLGFLFSPVSAAVINAVSKEQSATASSYYSLIMQIGGSIGISILAIVHQYVLKYNEQQGESTDISSHNALKIAFLVSAGILLIALWPALKLQKEPVKK